MHLSDERLLNNSAAFVSSNSLLLDVQERPVTSKEKYFSLHTELRELESLTFFKKNLLFDVLNILQFGRKVT